MTLDELGAQYRAAKASVAAHLRVQADAEIARARGTGSDEAVAKAEADVAWCRALVVACGEAYKGCTLAEAIEAQRRDRPSLDVLVPQVDMWLTKGR